MKTAKNPQPARPRIMWADVDLDGEPFFIHMHRVRNSLRPVLVFPGPLPQLRQFKKVLGMGEEELIAVMKTWISSGCEGDAEWPKAVLADFGLLPTTKGGKRK